MTWKEYSVTNNNLQIKSSSGSLIFYKYQFSNDKKNLTLSKDGAPLTFHKSSTF